MIIKKEDVIFDIDNLNICVIDSYLASSRKEIDECLDWIMAQPEFADMRKAGYTRNRSSMYNEWGAHNFLYRIGYKRDHTANVDINEAEPIWRRFCYWFLAKL